MAEYYSLSESEGVTATSAFLIIGFTEGISGVKTGVEDFRVLS
jgi:hypothetical protein